MSKGEKNKDLKTQLWGWGLFVVCSLLFILSSVRANDIILFVASILFFLGCVVFMVPLVQAIIRDE
jgi:succinate-acetate transporter protein